MTLDSLDSLEVLEYRCTATWQKPYKLESEGADIAHYEAFPVQNSELLEQSGLEQLCPEVWLR